MTDERGELMPGIRKLAKRKRIEPKVSRFERGRLSIAPHRVVHTSHLAFGYLIRVRRLVLAHVGRPTIRALDRGEALPFGELGKEKQVY